ncbi:MliC family protein [Rubellimicrobium aerolatum]|uniref:MliC family protein n=1 Tax=Rubellimicrobium aerolatum TaxID=490979 RepID=A0ABW0SB89_9RHOB|nr:MliC family protein [Rubellimicrobium aerolatum]MBP1805500.1 membrane-bound inhibitor of C-type lysozyme [Rubellimicrobium aerolatum]
MRRLLIPLAVLGLLAACEDMTTGPAPTAPPPPSPRDVAGAAIPPRQGFITYLCSDGTVVQANYSDNRGKFGIMSNASRSVLLSIDRQSVRLAQSVSANGTRYIGGGYEWVAFGTDTASLSREPQGAEPVACRSNGGRG